MRKSPDYGAHTTTPRAAAGSAEGCSAGTDGRTVSDRKALAFPGLGRAWVRLDVQHFSAHAGAAATTEPRRKTGSVVIFRTRKPG